MIRFAPFHAAGMRLMLLGASVLAAGAANALAIPSGAYTLQSTNRVTLAAAQPQVRPAHLAAGTTAPEFTAEKWGGGALKLSDYKGKVVILDFWATWCGPCQRSMPPLEKLYQRVKTQDVVVLALCVWDEKAAYTEWVPKNKSRYSFTFGYDPAGRKESSIATRQYQVPAIPTTYVIGKDRKVVDAVVGYQEKGMRLETALEAAGIHVDGEASSADAQSPAVWLYQQIPERLSRAKLELSE